VIELRSVLWRLWLGRKKKAAAELKVQKQRYKKSLSDLREKRAQLERVRGKRVRLFMDCFDCIADKIDSIYKV